MDEKFPITPPREKQEPPQLEVIEETSRAELEIPISQEEQETIRKESLEILDRVGESEVTYSQNSHELWDLIRYHNESSAEVDTKLEQLSEEKRAEQMGASQRLWKKVRIALTPLLVLYATPSQDSQMSPLNVERGNYSERIEASKQLEEKGITSHQRQAYWGALSDSLETNFTPWGYTGESGDMKTYMRDGARVIGGMVRGRDSEEDTNETRLRSAYSFVNERKRELDENRSIELANNRSDAWRMYLGMPQKHTTFGISEFEPSKNTEDIYYYKVQNFLRDTQMLIDDAEGMEDLKPIQFLLAVEEAQGSTERGTYSPLSYLVHSLRSSSNESFVAKDNISAIMGNFKLSKGHDEQGYYISYYDRWDLGGSIEGEDGVIGKPYEIYDRIYYDPQTFEVVQPQSIKK